MWLLPLITPVPRTPPPSSPIFCLASPDWRPPHAVMENRVEAIHWAMDQAQPGDVIVLCGKGHETYQEINHVKYHMDEREIVAEYLKEN